jgi:hypothetical protein
VKIKARDNGVPFSPRKEALPDLAVVDSLNLREADHPVMVGATSPVWNHNPPRRGEDDKTRDPPPRRSKRAPVATENPTGGRVSVSVEAAATPQSTRNISERSRFSPKTKTARGTFPSRSEPVGEFKRARGPPRDRGENALGGPGSEKEAGTDVRREREGPRPEPGTETVAAGKTETGTGAKQGWEELPGLSETEDRYRPGVIRVFARRANGFPRERGAEHIKNNLDEIGNQRAAALTLP